MKCLRKSCSNELPEKREKYCSDRCLNNYRVVESRRKKKLKAIEYKGGKCVQCGYSKSAAALQFHHRDPSQKDFGIGGRGENRSWEKTKLELDKCDLLCSNCHAEEHEKLDAT